MGTDNRAIAYLHAGQHYRRRADEHVIPNRNQSDFCIAQNTFCTCVMCKYVNPRSQRHIASYANQPTMRGIYNALRLNAAPPPNYKTPFLRREISASPRRSINHLLSMRKATFHDETMAITAAGPAPRHRLRRKRYRLRSAYPHRIRALQPIRLSPLHLPSFPTDSSLISNRLRAQVQA